MIYSGKFASWGLIVGYDSNSGIPLKDLLSTGRTLMTRILTKKHMRHIDKVHLRISCSCVISRLRK